MSWKEYEIDDDAIDEWLSWGGLLKDSVMKNKDGSFFSVIQYEPYLHGGKYIKNQNYKNGWNLWSEKQKRKGESQYFLVVSWNPEYDKADVATNTLYGQSVKRPEAIMSFEKEIISLMKEMSSVTSCKILEGQAILDFLAFTVSIGEHSVLMPEVSLYLDVLLSQDLDVDFFENGISINGKKMMILSLLAVPEMPIMDILYKALDRFSYRYVQRLLLFDEKAAQEELEKYLYKWCSGRKSLKKVIMADILSNLNGYYSASFIFLIDEGEYDEMMAYCKDVFNALEIPYLFEAYNLKDVWWGSLPGLFRANITAPITGFSHLDDLLIRQSADGKEQSHVPTESI